MQTLSNLLVWLGLKGGATTPAEPVDAGATSAPPASQEFLAACAATQKAWYQSNLLSISKPAAIRSARTALVRDGDKELVALLLEIMGPVAPAQLKDAMGRSSNHHREMAKLVCSLAMRVALADRQPAAMVDLERVKSMLVAWIDTGDLGVGDSSAEARQARKMAELVSGSAHASRVRLAIVAPLAPALETLLVVSKLSESLMTTLEATSAKVRGVQAAAADHAKADAPTRPQFKINPVARAAAGVDR